MDPLDFGDYMRQLYRTIGKDLRGDCLINSSNFHLNFMVGMSFGADRSERHLDLQEKASTYLEIDIGINENIPTHMIPISMPCMTDRFKSMLTERFKL